MHPRFLAWAKDSKVNTKRRREGFGDELMQKSGYQQEIGMEF
jgi:hypothetical protein